MYARSHEVHCYKPKKHSRFPALSDLARGGELQCFTLRDAIDRGVKSVHQARVTRLSPPFSWQLPLPHFASRFFGRPAPCRMVPKPVLTFFVDVMLAMRKVHFTLLLYLLFVRDRCQTFWRTVLRQGNLQPKIAVVCNTGY